MAGDDVLGRIDPRLCVACKAARGLCGIDPCPLLQRVQHHLPKVRVAGKDLFGSSPPSLFVGRHGYPHVTVGPMLPPEHLDDDRAHRLDDPASWMDSLTIPDVVGLRSGLVRTTHRVRVHDASAPDRITRLSQELAVAARPVDTEVHLSRVPRFTAAHVGEFTAPHGPTVEVERAQLAENVRVERRVEAVTSDTDLLAQEGLVDLYRNGTDPYQLERILSAGMLGRGARRRLVPTRWAITATDDALGKALIGQVRDLPTVDGPVVHAAERFGNRFFVLLLPRVWGFELVEAWLKGSFWALAGPRGDAAAPAVPMGPAAPPGPSMPSAPSAPRAGPVLASDHEDHRGRTAYAANTTGGYYATRIAVLEHLIRIRCQAAAVVLREITDAYTTPLGVWVVREACRRAMAAPGLPFEDAGSALRHIRRHARSPEWEAEAPFLRTALRQRTLDGFP